MRPILRPGTHVLRRAPGELQVGLDPGSALVLPDSPAVRGTLRRISSAAQPVSGEDPDAGTVALLEEHGQLIDEATCCRCSGTVTGTSHRRDGGAGPRGRGRPGRDPARPAPRPHRDRSASAARPASGCATRSWR